MKNQLRQSLNLYREINDKLVTTKYIAKDLVLENVCLHTVKIML